MARQLQVEIIGDARSLNRALNSSQSTTKGFAKNLGHLGRVAAGVAGAAGIGALIYTLKAGISEYAQSQKVAAQTNAVIKSTGSAANVTAKEVSGLATALMKKSGIDDEVIASGENMLLTFKNIRNEAGKGNDIFTQSTKTLVDFSVATGKDATSSAILLGKALNDPIKGLTALQRVGVTFSEGQKKTIKALVESGHAMDAQKIILRELNSEFGGSAEALGKTLPGQINILKESFNNWAGDMVAKMIPVLTQFGNWIRTNMPAIKAMFDRFSESTRKLTSAFVSMLPPSNQARATIIAFKPVIAAVTPLVNALANAARAMAPAMRVAFGIALGAVRVFATVSAASLRMTAFEIRAVIAVGRAVGGALKASFSAGAAAVRAAERTISGAVSGVVSVLQTIARWALAAMSAVNALISALGRIHVPSISLPHVGNPFRAAGGPVKAGHSYVVGEKGPEMFTPGRSGMITPNDRGAGLGLAGSGGGVTMVNLNVDGKTLAKILIDPLRAEAKIVSQRTGRPAFG